MRLSLVLAAALLAAALVALCRPQPRPAADLGAAPDPAERAASTSDAGSALGPRDTVADEERAEPVGRQPAAQPTSERSEERTVRIRGHVELPGGHPPGEEVRVSTEGVSTAVDGAGAFELVVETSPRYELGLEARFLHLEAPVRLRRDDVAEEVVLRPTLAGRVVGRVIPPRGTDGTSLAGSTVLLRTMEGVERRADLDEALRFTFDGVPPTFLAVVAVEPRGWLAAQRWTRIDPGVVTTIDVALEVAARVAGRVVDDTGAPVANARVELRPRPRSPETGRAGEWDGDATVAGEDGSFLLVAPPSLRVTLAASAQGHQDHERELGLRTAGRPPLDVEVVLERGTGIRGVVSRSDGRPAAGASVVILGPRGKRVAESVAGEDGAFETEALADGPYDVVASAGPVGAPEELGRAACAWALVEGVAPGDEVSLVLDAGSDVQGLATDELGAPLGRFTVHVAARVARTGPFWRRAVGSGSVRGRDGAFALRGLPPGRYSVHAESAGVESAPTALDVPGGAMPTLRVSRPAVLSGTVLGPDGRPLEGAAVRAGGDRTRSRAAGAFVLEKVAAGNVELAAAYDDLPDAVLELALGPGEERRDVRLQFARFGGIEGSLDPSAAPLAEREVVLRDGNDEQAGETVTDPEGRFRFPRLAPGRYTLGLFPDEESDLSFGDFRTVDVPPGSSVRVVLGERSPVEVHGTVTSAGEPLADAVVVFRRELVPRTVGEGRYSFTLATFDGDLTERTDAEGRYELTLRGPGDYEIHVEDAFLRRSISEDREISVDLGGLTLEGTITAAPAPSAYRELWPSSPWVARPFLIDLRLVPVDGPGEALERRAMVFPGRFSLRNVSPGEYRLHVASHEREWPWLVRDVEVGESSTEVTIALEPSARVVGDVLDADGAFVADATLRLLRDDGVDVVGEPAGASRHDGAYRLTRVPGGTLIVTAEKDGRTGRSRAFSVAPGETLRVDVRLE